MDDAESEGVLLALGSALEWTQPDDKERHFVADTDSVRVERYQIFYGGKKWMIVYTLRYPAPFERDTTRPPDHSTLAAAKAACERHHATGKWGN